MKLGWTCDIVGSVGEKFVQVVTDTFWTLDPHNSFMTELVHCPLCSAISRDSMIGRAQLNQEILEKHIALLSDYLLQPWFCS